MLIKYTGNVWLQILFVILTHMPRLRIFGANDLMMTCPFFLHLYIYSSEPIKAKVNLSTSEGQSLDHISS